MTRTNQFGQPIGDAVDGWKPATPPARECMEGRYCRLEPIDVGAHLDSLYEAQALDENGRNWTYLPYGPFGRKDEYRSWMEDTCLGDDPLFFAILDRESGRATGVASYLRITPQIGSIEVGHLYFSPLLQRTRAATEAMFLMAQRAFALGNRRYEWKCDSHNAPSKAAAERLGFRYEGTFRQHTVVKGRNRDTTWLSILDGEWPALRTAFETWLAPENFDESGRQMQSLSELTAAARPQLA